MAIHKSSVIDGQATAALARTALGLGSAATLPASTTGAANSVPSSSSLTTLDPTWLPTTEQWVASAPAYNGTGIKSQMYWDATSGYLYICVATNTWIRIENPVRTW